MTTPLSGVAQHTGIDKTLTPSQALGQTQLQAPVAETYPCCTHTLMHAFAEPLYLHDKIFHVAVAVVSICCCKG